MEKRELSYTVGGNANWYSHCGLLKDLLIQGNKMSGLLDTGADVSCIAGKDWPSSWPTCLTSAGRVGIGSVPLVAKRSQILTWSDEKGAQDTFCPYMIPSLPFSLWGRDILSQMGMLLYSPVEKVTILIRGLVKISRELFRH